MTTIDLSQTTLSVRVIDVFNVVVLNDLDHLRVGQYRHTAAVDIYYVCNMYQRERETLSLCRFPYTFLRPVLCRLCCSGAPFRDVCGDELFCRIADSNCKCAVDGRPDVVCLSPVPFVCETHCEDHRKTAQRHSISLALSSVSRQHSLLGFLVVRVAACTITPTTRPADGETLMYKQDFTADFTATKA